jgi:drug/metabolite transporter (DMT)-like permease
VDPPLGFAVATAAALSFAAGVFSGAVVSRRVTPLSAALSVQVISAAGLAVLLVVSAAPMTPAAVVTGWLAGLAVATGLFALYVAMASGAIGVVAVVTGVAATSLALGFDGIAGGRVPSVLQLLGIGCALAGAGFSARLGTVSARVALLSLIAGIAFGSSFILYNRASGESPVAVLFNARLSATLLLGAVWLVSTPRRFTLRPLIGLAGILDTLANGLMLVAVTLTPVSLATAITSAEPPVIVMLLARGVLGEALPGTAYRAIGLGSIGIALMLLG